MIPPSTVKVAPVTWLDSSLARNSAAFTTSRGCASRPIGQCTPPLELSGVSSVQVEEQRGLHRPRAQRVHPDPLTRKLSGELPAHRQDRTLGCRVRDLRRCGAHERHERRDVDHRAAPALEQVRDPVLAAEEDALRVHVLDALPDLHRCLQNGRVLVGRDAGVVVQDVDPTKPIGGGAHHRLDRPFVGNVDRERECRTIWAEANRFRGRSLVDVGDAHARALRGEHLGRHASHAAARPGDDACLPVEPAHQRRRSSRYAFACPTNASNRRRSSPSSGCQSTPTVKRRSGSSTASAVPSLA